MEYFCNKKSAWNSNSENLKAFNFTESYFVEEFDEYRFDPKIEMDENFNFNNSDAENPKNWLGELEFFAKNNSSKLKIVHLNIKIVHLNSIFCKGLDWAYVLRKNIFDIGFVQESKLGPLTPDSFVSDINYNLIRRDRIAGGGGLLVLVNKGYVLSDIDIDIDEKFETIKFSINFMSKNKKCTRISQATIHISRCRTTI